MHYFFSWYELCGNNNIFKPNNNKVKIGLNKKKKKLSVIIEKIYI
jgi:hypothetical protein